STGKPAGLNLNGAILNVTAPAAVISGDGSGQSSITNSSSTINFLGTNSTTVAVRYNDSSGSLIAQGGTVDFTGGGMFSQTSFTGAGRIRVSNDASFYNCFSPLGNLEFAGGTFTS